VFEEGTNPHAATPCLRDMDSPIFKSWNENRYITIVKSDQ